MEVFQRLMSTDHAGTMTFESEPHCGTRCLLRFPLLDTTLHNLPMTKDAEERLVVQELKR